MDVAVLASGGKDSSLALYNVLRDGHFVKYLVSMFPLNDDSWMFHYPNIRLVKLFAEAAEIPLESAETLGVKEKEVKDLKLLLERLDIDAVVSGAIASIYQKSRIEKICKQLNLKCICPLWNEEPINVLRNLMKLKFEVLITGVSAYGFNIEWLGKKISQSLVDELLELNKKYGISIIGEGGEYETLVLDAPFFKKKIKIVQAESFWRSQSGYFRIKKAKLENK